MNDSEAQDDSGGSLQAGRRGVFRIFVCLAGACVGAFFGSFEYPLGTVLGAVGGVVAGILWTGIMFRRARSGLGQGRILAAGTVWGMAVGLLATAILHGGLYIVAMVQAQGAGRHVPDLYGVVLGIAVVCAVVGGAITGFVCGAIVAMSE